MKDLTYYLNEHHYSKNLLKKLWNDYVYLRNKFFDNNHVMRESVVKEYESQTLKFGNENSDKTFYVISSVDAEYNGTFEYWMIIAYYVLYATKHGYIPFVYDNNNRWERSFVQPQTEYGFNEISRSSNVKLNGKFVVGGFNWNWWPPFSNYFGLLRREYHDVYKIIHPQKHIRELADRFFIPPNTMAMPLRRSFESGQLQKIWLYNQYPHHHRRGFLDDYIKFGNKILRDGRCEYLFLACDDRETLEILKNEFGDNCLYYERHLVHNMCGGKPVPRDSKELFSEFGDKPNDEIRRIIEIEYIVETMLMSACDSIFNTPGSQVVMARIMAENDIPIIDSDIPFRLI